MIRQLKQKWRDNRIVRTALLILLAVSALYVLWGMSQPHLQPFKKTIQLNNLNVENYQESEKGFVAVWEKKLLFADSQDRLLSLKTVDKDGHGGQPRKLAIDGEYVYVLVAEEDDLYNYFVGEELQKYTLDGEYLGNIYRKEYSVDEQINYSTLTDLYACEGKVWIVETVGKEAKLICIPSNGYTTAEETKPFAAITLPENIQRGEYKASKHQLYLYNRYGEAYVYDLSDRNLTGPVEMTKAALNKEGFSVEIKTGIRQLLLDLGFYAGIVVLGLALLVVIVRFLRSDIFAKHRLPAIFALFVFLTIAYYTKYSLDLFDLNFGERLSSMGDTLNVAFGYLSEDYFEQDEDADYSEIFKSQEFRREMEWVNSFLKQECKAGGMEMGMYAQIYLTDKNHVTYLVADSYDEYPVGMTYEELDGLDDSRYARNAETAKVTIQKETDGVYAFCQKHFISSSGRITGFVEVGSEFERLRYQEIRKAIESALQLVAFIVFLYVLFDVGYRYRGDIEEYKRLKHTDPSKARLCLSNVYDFLVSAMMYIDFYLLVKAVASICSGQKGVNLALMLAIPLTGYRIGSWAGSAITSLVIDKLGERRSAVISALLSVLSFAGMAAACELKNIWIFTICKIMEGVFLESILFAIAEGVPYAIKDEKLKERKILESQSATSAAILIILMIAGILAEYVNYIFLYMAGAAGCAVLIPLSMLVLGRESEENDEEEENASGLAAWLSFLKPKSLIYLVLIVLPISLLYGFEEYIFPLFAESTNVSDMMLSSIGVFANAMSYFGASVLVLFKKKNPVQAIVTAFSVCGVLLMLFILNTTLLWAVLVLFMINIMLRVVDNFKIISLIHINEKDGIDGKMIQERYYAIEDGFRILQGPVFGFLAGISNVVCCAFLGLLCLVFPRAYSILTRRVNRVNRDGSR